MAVALEPVAVREPRQHLRGQVEDRQHGEEGHDDDANLGPAGLGEQGDVNADVIGPGGNNQQGNREGQPTAGMLVDGRGGGAAEGSFEANQDGEDSQDAHDGGLRQASQGVGTQAADQ
jgi:hypothetical protein